MTKRLDLRFLFAVIAFLLLLPFSPPFPCVPLASRVPPSSSPVPLIHHRTPPETAKVAARGRGTGRRGRRRVVCVGWGGEGGPERGAGGGNDGDAVPDEEPMQAEERAKEPPMNVHTDVGTHSSPPLSRMTSDEPNPHLIPPYCHEGDTSALHLGEVARGKRRLLSTALRHASSDTAGPRGRQTRLSPRLRQDAGRRYALLLRLATVRPQRSITVRF